MMNEPFRKQNIAVPEHSFYLFLILFLRPAPCTTQMIFLIQLTLPSKSPDPVLLSVIADRKIRSVNLLLHNNMIPRLKSGRMSWPQPFNIDVFMFHVTSILSRRQTLGIQFS